MIAIDRMTQSTWSADQISVAMCSLVRHVGWSLDEAPALANWPPPEDDPDEIDRWLTAAAESMGVETEAVSATYPKCRAALLASPPALVVLDVMGQRRYLAVVRRRGQQLMAATPSGSVVPLPVHTVLEHLSDSPAADLRGTLDRLLPHMPARRRARAQQALGNELLGSRSVAIGWLLRTGPRSGLSIVSHHFGLPRRLFHLIAAYTLAAVLWMLSWWLLGWAVLGGVMEFGWLGAWVLALVSLVPLRIWTQYAAGQVALRGALVLKQRLMEAAVRMPRDAMSGSGVGGLLGRIAETETLDSQATLGGFLVVTAGVELLAATAVLALGAAPGLHLVLVAIVTVWTIGLILRYSTRYRHWTNHRLELTGDLIEKMLGQRTRIVQQPEAEWHRGEDQLLEQSLIASARLDADAVRVRILLPRTWFVLGLAALAVPLLFGHPAAAALAVSLGALLMASESWARMGEGLLRLTAARTAWSRVRTMISDAQLIRHRKHAPLPESHHARSNETLLEARSISYQYPGRAQQVLERVDLRIEDGDRLLLQGESGGGKSTLAQLLAGGRHSQTGVMLLAGLDRAALGAEGWRKLVVLAPQFHENHVVMGSLALNLLMGRRWPPNAEDLKAAEETCQGLGLGPLLDRMPGGLFQIVGETGWQLSHGERSRVFLARALLQRGRLLILDESFAALDPDTQKTVFRFVQQTAPALMVIAHP